MLLRDLTSRIGTAAPVRMAGPDAGDLLVTGVTLDSRSVVPGDVYAALPGFNVHGARFVADAVAAGAVAVLTDDDGLPSWRGWPSGASRSSWPTTPAASSERSRPRSTGTRPRT